MIAGRATSPERVIVDEVRCGSRKAATPGRRILCSPQRPPLPSPAAEPDPQDELRQRPSPPPTWRCRYRPWAELLRRAFAIDVTTCPRRGGPLRLLALVKDPEGIARSASPPSRRRALLPVRRRTGRVVCSGAGSPNPILARGVGRDPRQARPHRGARLSLPEASPDVCRLTLTRLPLISRCARAAHDVREPHLPQPMEPRLFHCHENSGVRPQDHFRARGCPARAPRLTGRDPVS